ncbi:HD domain-containing protein [bacterium]|nr:HD domain-containing protein [bacterium]
MKIKNTIRHFIFSLHNYIKRRLYLKVILFMFLILVIWIGSSTYISIYMQTRQFLDNSRRRAILLTETIENSIVHSMLIGKHDDVRDLLFTIGSESDMRDLRIVTEDGLILISAKMDEEGQKTELPNLNMIRNGQREVVHIDLERRLISMLKPIEGKPPCYECHTKDENIMGVLDVNVSIAWMSVPIIATRVFMIISAVFTLLLISISIYFILGHLVDRPVRRLIRIMDIVRNGDWHARVKVDTEDEIGELGNTFNFMIKEINSLHEEDLKKENALVKAEEELKYKSQIEEKNRLLQRTLNILTTLNNIGKDINSVLDIDTLLDSILKMTSAIVHAKAGLISVVERNTGEIELKCLVCADKGKEFWEDSIHRKIAKYVFESEKALLLPDFKADGRFLGNGDRTYIPKTVLYAPLQAKGKIIGIIGMIDRDDGCAFSVSDLELLTTISCEAAVALENSNLYRDLKKSYFDAIRALVNAIEAKDPYTYGHSERVTRLSLEVGRSLNLGEKSLEVIRHAGILHDVGKIGVSLNILHKTINLTPEEIKIIREHSQIGSRIIDHIDFLKDVKDGIRHHHERYDGKGYPDGLGPSDISIETKILSVADSYDAMTSDRPYRKAKSHEAAIEELRRCAGTQFDPKVVHAFIQVLDRQMDKSPAIIFDSDGVDTKN